jgi:hypothetical protein
MRNKFFIALILTVSFFATGAALAASTLDVFVVGSLHRNYLDPSWGFSLGDLRETVIALQPDLLCLEVDPRYENTALTGIFPPEAVVLEQLAKDLSIDFACVDWRADINDYKPTSARVETLIQPLHKRFVTNTKKYNGTQYQYIAGSAGQRLTRQMHETILRHDGEAADGFWVTRNTKIVENSIREARERNAKRIVLVFGMDHKYIIEEYLRRYADVRVGLVSVVKDRRSWHPSTSIINTWQNNLDNLRKLQGSPNTDRSVLKWIDSLKRDEELSMFIRWGESTN